jgi:hypothetical protein
LVLSEVSALVATGLAIATGSTFLVVICWKTRTSLGGILGAVSIGLVALAIASGPAHGGGDYQLAGAGVALVLGATLYGIGHALQRLLDDDAEESTSDRG